MKIETNIAKAIDLFRTALELDPNHEDSRYYLANCLAMQREWDAALSQLAELIRINPQSHRGHMRWGTIRAMAAASKDDLLAAERSLERAQRINPEETGALLVLGEVALLRNDWTTAEQRFAAACRTNPKATGGFFLRGYVAWKRGDDAASTHFLTQTREALGKDWQPQGSTSEGDVKKQQHTESSPLVRFWQQWNGLSDPAKAYFALDEFLESKSAPGVARR